MKAKDIKDILDDSPDPLIDLAAQCRNEDDLRDKVKAFLRKTKVAKGLTEVVDKSGVKPDREAMAEVLFAYGAMALTILATTHLEKMRAVLLAEGHPDCSKGAPCPTTGEKCTKMVCPFYVGLHPIRHMDAIANGVLDEEVSSDELIRYALDQSVAEA